MLKGLNLEMKVALWHLEFWASSRIIEPKAHLSFVINTDVTDWGIVFSLGLYIEIFSLRCVYSCSNIIYWWIFWKNVNINGVFVHLTFILKNNFYLMQCNVDRLRRSDYQFPMSMLHKMRQTFLALPSESYSSLN